jgi:hypothetical protein
MSRFKNEYEPSDWFYLVCISATALIGFWLGYHMP